MVFLSGFQQTDSMAAILFLMFGAEEMSRSDNLTKISFHVYPSDRVSGLLPQTNSLWDQQKQLWSKSTPQHLHGLEALDSVTTPQLGQNVSCSVPELEKSANLVEQTALFESADSNDLFNPSGARPSTYSSLEEERGLHRPDGADDPDEHMWLYEDPQGRTQGSFSDAQMNDWLLAGIYFTPNLRIRRKCDNTFSTLADYTRLFGRIPFVPGPRISPIRGGITPPTLNALPKSVSVEHPSSNDLVDGVSSSGLQHSVGLSSTSQSSIPISVSYVISPKAIKSYLSASYYQLLVSRSIVECLHGTTVASAMLFHGPFRDTILRTSSMCVNSSLPVLQSRSQVNSLSNALSGLTTSIESDSHLIGNTGHLVNGTSAFMALASLLSMNPTLASLALSFSGHSTGGHNPDLAAAALSPGFLSALAQYLNVQPHSSNHQPTSPMQQLAETAQLAAQLAALAGAHSPDQTPMQPEQALALAQLVISQVVTDSGHDPETDTIDRRLDKSINDESAARSHSLAHTGDDTRQDQQSHWPPLFSTSSATRSSPRFGDGRYPTKSGRDASTHGDHRDGQSRVPVGFPTRQHQSKTPVQTTSTRTSTGKSKHSNGAVFQSVQTTEPMPYTSPTNQSTWRSAGDVTEDCHGKDGHPERNRGTATQLPSSRAPPTIGQWAHKVKQTSLKPASQVTRTVTENGRATTCVTNTSPNTANKSTGLSANHNNRAATNQSAASTNFTRSPVKSISYQSETKASKSASRSDQFSARPPNDSDRTAQEELERLTSWCQTRLSSVPLREKVDIPTVVELLATLDAPYEVERMVQTFMGESARTSLFVKDFLDRRRPFWQLHRERRDNETFTQSVSQSANSANGNVPKSSDRKKRSGGQDNSTQTTNRQNAGTNNMNGAPGSTKVGQPAQLDQSQDNQQLAFNRPPPERRNRIQHRPPVFPASVSEPKALRNDIVTSSDEIVARIFLSHSNWKTHLWRGSLSLTRSRKHTEMKWKWHHIKPKGGHNRKSKKDKVSKLFRTCIQTASNVSLSYRLVWGHITAETVEVSAVSLRNQVLNLSFNQTRAFAKAGPATPTFNRNIENIPFIPCSCKSLWKKLPEIGHFPTSVTIENEKSHGTLDKKKCGAQNICWSLELKCKSSILPDSRAVVGNCVDRLLFAVYFCEMIHLINVFSSTRPIFQCAGLFVYKSFESLTVEKFGNGSYLNTTSNVPETAHFPYLVLNDPFELLSERP
ncbi:PERQ amino acid-rich with GYF domain-containing protein 2 [Clonorchis sinensis]|uniref:PERQ amino acid-rich with GYF domain-containing protein 2 n=1 Tax=Clonorchis sinensis TaxID=79923 RepID=G7YGX8_CLOSI|nr:PERQ amino acid-rich with GYF domain-containing protein 2 [Clonorchis sinensis]